MDKDFKVRFTKAYRDVVMALMYVKDNPTIELSYIGIILAMNDFIDIMGEWDTVFEDDLIRSKVERLVYAIEGVGLWGLVDEPYAEDLSFIAVEAQKSLN